MLLYLTNIPVIKVITSEIKENILWSFFQYKTQGKEMIEDCDIDFSLVNSLGLSKRRITRSPNNQDYGFGTGAIFDSG